MLKEGGFGHLRRGLFDNVVVDLDQVDDVIYGVNYHGYEWERPSRS